MKGRSAQKMECFGKGGNGMIRIRAFGLIIAFVMFLAIAAPAAAAEKSFDLKIPGCTA
jgi:hypothetical protein